MDGVSRSSSCLVAKTESLINREKGDASKTRDFLPSDKQYLAMCGVPCLHRATSLAYTDADEDAERLLSFADASSPSGDGDEWVETHAGCQAHQADSATNADEITDIPDPMGMGHMRMRRGSRKGWGACRWVVREEEVVRGLRRRRRLTWMISLIWRRMIWGKGMRRLRLLRLRCRLYLLLVWLMLGMFVGFAGDQKER